MSFGFSVGDCVLLLGIAKKQYQNCRAAGAEYIEIAREVKCLCGVLKLLRSEAEKGGDSWLQLQDADATAELAGAIGGCRHILEDLQVLLARYEGLSGDGEPVGLRRKISNRIGFGSKIQSLGEIRGKIIMYTSTISVVLDAMQLKATGRLEDRMNVGFSQLQENFHSMRKSIVEEVLKARSAPKWKSAPSVLSLSTYAEDDKEIWQEFRRELVIRGFRSKQLDRHKDVLKAYMLKLEQNGILDEMQLPESTDQEPWWTKRVFSETVDTLQNLQPIAEEHDHAAEPSEDEREDKMAAREGFATQISLTKPPASKIDLPAVSSTSEPSGSSSTTTLVLPSQPEHNSYILTSVSPPERSPSTSKLSLEIDEDTKVLQSQTARSSIELDPTALPSYQDHISIPENLETIPPTSENQQNATDTLNTSLPESSGAKPGESIIDDSQPTDTVRASSEEIPDPAVESTHETTLRPTEAELREAFAALLNIPNTLSTKGTATTSGPKEDMAVVGPFSDLHAPHDTSSGAQRPTPRRHESESKSTGARDKAGGKLPWGERIIEEDEARQKRRRALNEAHRARREREESSEEEEIEVDMPRRTERTSKEDKARQKRRRARREARRAQREEEEASMSEDYRRRTERTPEEQEAHDKRQRERTEKLRAAQREQEEASTSEDYKEEIYRRRTERTTEEQEAHDMRRRERREAHRVAREREGSSTSEGYEAGVYRRRTERTTKEQEAHDKRRRERREARRAQREQEETSTSEEYDVTSMSEDYETSTSEDYDETSTSEDYETSTSEDYKGIVDTRRTARTPEEEEAHQKRRRERREARRARREQELTFTSEEEDEEVFGRRRERTKSRALPLLMFMLGGLAAFRLGKDKGGGKEKGHGGKEKSGSGKEKEPRSYVV